MCNICQMKRACNLKIDFDVWIFFNFVYIFFLHLFCFYPSESDYVNAIIIICEILLLILLYFYFEIKIHHVWDNSFKLSYHLLISKVYFVLSYDDLLINYSTRILAISMACATLIRLLIHMKPTLSYQISA